MCGDDGSGDVGFAQTKAAPLIVAPQGALWWFLYVADKQEVNSERLTVSQLARRGKRLAYVVEVVHGFPLRHVPSSDRNGRTSINSIQRYNTEPGANSDTFVAVTSAIMAIRVDCIQSGRAN